MLNNPSNNSNKDHQISVLIDDTVQCLRFYPSNDIIYLASGGWDGKLRIFDIKKEVISTSADNDNVTINSKLFSICQHKSPILSLSWFGNNAGIFTGCCDGSINYVDCTKNTLTKIGEHQFGCREVIYLDNYNLLISGGWDGLLKLWDLRASNTPIAKYQFLNKIYTMSYSKNLLVIGLSESVVSYFNLNNLQQSKFEPRLIYLSHTKSQIKKIAILKDADGYIEGCNLGRVAVKYLDINNPKLEDNGLKNIKDFSFKCHREIKNNIIYTYPINDIAVNPFYGTICTAGGDGNFTIWDLEKRRRIIEKKNLEDKTPLTACEYNKMGDLLVYASGYDWSKGAQYAHLYPRPKIYVHYVQKNERKSS